MNTYSICITDKAPAMTQTKTVIEAATYAEAVEIARAMWKVVNRTTALFSGEYGTYWYHLITAEGLAIDRNINSGVPAQQRLEALS